MDWISATSSGLAQCMLLSFGGLAPAAKGLILLSTALSCGRSLRITASPKPVPTPLEGMKPPISTKEANFSRNVS